MLSSVVFKAQWQIICFDKNNEQSGKMILRAETEIGKEGWKTCRVFKKKKIGGFTRYKAQAWDPALVKNLKRRVWFVSPQSHSPFSSLLQTFRLTARVLDLRKNYGLSCSLPARRETVTLTLFNSEFVLLQFLFFQPQKWVCRVPFFILSLKILLSVVVKSKDLSCLEVVSVSKITEALHALSKVPEATKFN